MYRVCIDLLKFCDQKKHIIHQGKKSASTPQALPHEQMQGSGRAGREEFGEDSGRLRGLVFLPVSSGLTQCLAQNKYSVNIS